jgi:hypothetical protein
VGHPLIDGIGTRPIFFKLALDRKGSAALAISSLLRDLLLRTARSHCAPVGPKLRMRHLRVLGSRRSRSSMTPDSVIAPVLLRSGRSLLQ